MTISEKLTQRKARREKIMARMNADKEELSKLDKEITTLEALDIRAMLQEVNIPFEEARRLIREMAPKPSSTQKENET